MGLFSAAAIDKINAVAAKSKATLSKPKPVNTKSINRELNEASAQVQEYFKDSDAILITTEEDLYAYVDAIVSYGYAGIDTETTGLDRVKDYIVGASLYVPGKPECYIPIKHKIPIFEELYKGQLTYEQVNRQFQRIADAGVKLIFANADFDLAMIFKDIKVDFCTNCYYDVITAWRCLKENELHNDLKSLYNKYVLKGAGNPKKFTDFFSPALFPYCKPEVAKLYAANDAKITFDLFRWQLPYVTKDHPKCKRNHLERIADLVWNIEIPMITVCQMMHRTGVYLDPDIYTVLQERYRSKYNAEIQKLKQQVQDILDNTTYVSKGKRPFLRGADFSPTSTQHVQYLCYTILNLPVGKDGQTTSKEVLATYNVPVINQILKVRSLSVLINTFVEKLPNSTTPDSRIHAQFRSIGADCIVGSSIIPTDKGWVRLGELCESYNVQEGVHTPVDDICICNMNQEKEKAESVIKYTDYPVIEITTECGLSIRGTYNHPILMTPSLTTGAPFVTLEDVSVGDHVMIPVHFNVGPHSYAKIDPDALGTAVDDSITVPEYMTEDFATYLGSNYTSCIPEAIWRSPAWVIRAYIKGLTASCSVVRQCDGSIFMHLPNLNYNDARFIQQFLLSQGILSKQMLTDSEDASSQISLCIDTSDYLRFRQRIGFVDPVDDVVRDDDTYADTSDSQSNYIWLTVVRKEYSTDTVYDFTVPGTHSFVSNGFISHNTGRMSSAEPNCQNIPSHATDIRHMFRATPEATYEVESTLGDTGDVTLVLPGYHMLETPTGTSKVHELNPGDTVIACDGANNSMTCQVVSNVEKMPGSHELKLKVIGGTE